MIVLPRPTTFLWKVAALFTGVIAVLIVSGTYALFSRSAEAAAPTSWSLSLVPGSVTHYNAYYHTGEQHPEFDTITFTINVTALTRDAWIKYSVGDYENEIPIHPKNGSDTTNIEVYTGKKLPHNLGGYTVTATLYEWNGILGHTTPVVLPDPADPLNPRLNHPVIFFQQLTQRAGPESIFIPHPDSSSSSSSSSSLSSGASGGHATWTGGGSSSSWGDSANWDTGVVPSSSDTAVIPAGSSLVANSSINVANLFIQSGASLALGSNSLTVSGTIENDGFISAVGDQSLSAANISGGGDWLILPATCSQNLPDLPFSALVTGGSTCSPVFAPSQPIGILVIPSNTSLELENTPDVAAIAVASNATLNLNNADLSVGLLTVDGTVSGSGTISGDILVETGGTLDLSQSTGFTGSIWNDGGTVLCPAGQNWDGSQCAAASSSSSSSNSSSEESSSSSSISVYHWAGMGWDFWDWSHANSWQEGIVPPNGADVTYTNIGGTAMIPTGYSITPGTVTFNGSIQSYGTISGGTFTGNTTVQNYGTITGGTFTGNTTENYGTITGGSFSTIENSGIVDLTGSPAPSVSSIINESGGHVLCSVGTNWNGSFCVSCPSNAPLWDSATNSCYSCYEATYGSAPAWNGSFCVSCPSNAPAWNSSTNSCSTCYDMTNGSNPEWNGTYCVSCAGNNPNYPIWNANTNSCDTCAGNDSSSPYWDGSQCSPCPSGESWNGSQCSQ